MRNPIRLKNLNSRFLPFYLMGLLLLVFLPPPAHGYIAAAPLVLLGLGLRSWGAGHLVKNDVLTMTGPYAHLRHPLYAGMILIATGFAVLFGGAVGFVLVAVIWPWFAFRYFPRKDRIETDRLEAMYGDAYRRYRDAVPALWPRWRPARPAGSDALANGSSAKWALERYSDNNELGTLLAVLVGMGLIGLRSVWAGA